MGSSEERGSFTHGIGEEPAGATPAAVSEEPTSQGRIRRAFSSSRELVRIAYRDPEHVSERLTLYTAGRLGDPSRQWAESARNSRPDLHPAQIAEELRTDSAHVARIDGAIAGTPFFIALVPGYLTYLVQEMRMTLRTAALYDRDPRDLRTSAEMLALRGIHPDIEAAEAALTAVRDKGIPDRPQKRRSLRTWVHSVYLLLVFGGFMSPSAAKEDKGTLGKVKAVFSVLVGVGIWADHLGVPRHVHDRDGVGLRDPRPPTRPQNTPLLRRRGHKRPRRDQGRRSATRPGSRQTRDPPCRRAVPLDRRSDRLHRLRRSRSQRRTGSMGLARSARSSRCRW